MTAKKRDHGAGRLTGTGGGVYGASPMEPATTASPVNLPEGAPQGPTDEFFTVDEAAAFLKTSRSTLYRHIDDGKIGGWFLLGDEIRFSRTLLIRWAEDEVGRSRRKRRRARKRPSK